MCRNREIDQPNRERAPLPITPKMGSRPQVAPNSPELSKFLQTGPIQAELPNGDIMSILFAFFPSEEITVASLLRLRNDTIIDETTAEVRRFHGDEPSRFVGRTEALKKALSQVNLTLPEGIAIADEMVELERDNITPPHCEIDPKDDFERHLTPEKAVQALRRAADDLEAHPLRVGEGFTIHIDGVETDTVSVAFENFSEVVE